MVHRSRIIARTPTNCSGRTLQLMSSMEAPLCTISYDFLLRTALSLPLADFIQTNGDSQWKNRTQSFLSVMSIFFNKNGIIYEIACEQQKTCNHDQYAFKGIALQWMGDTVQIAPFTSDTIIPYLKSSAQAAAASCKGGDSKHACGFDWTSSDYDRKTGFGPELNALNVFVANLAATSPGPTIEAASSQNPSSTSSASASPTPGTAKSPSSTSSAGPSASSSAQSTSMAAVYLPLQTGLPALFLLVAMAFSLM